MSHDKIRAAARQRMAETGEPYAAARRAAVTEHLAGGQNPSPGAGYALRMSGEIHDWLADLRDRDPEAARLVVQAVTALMTEGAALGEPLVVSTAESWPGALTAALDRSYQERLEELRRARRGEADAATLARDIRAHAAGLESAQEKLANRHRRAVEAERPEEAAEAAAHLAAIQRQAAELRQLLPRVEEARQRLNEANLRRQARADAFRTSKEVLKARVVAAEGQIKVLEALAASSLTGDDGGEPEEDGAETISAAQARRTDVIARMERELGQEPWPEGLLELLPGMPDNAGVRVLFAVEPPGTVLLIAVLEGVEAFEDHYPEAIVLAADMLRRVRAGRAPEAIAHGYRNVQSFLEEFGPEGRHGDTG